MSDLTDYLRCVNETADLFKAWEKYWANKDKKVGSLGVPSYKNRIANVPYICTKVPTGGGKTFMGCSALKRIFNYFPSDKIKLVVWLVPSDSILTQTINSLSNPEHPYRRSLDKDFAGRVEVCTKEMLLSGQNFTPDTVREMLSICVLSYASLRIDSKKKDVRKVFQENGNLMRFAECFGQRSLREQLPQSQSDSFPTWWGSICMTSPFKKDGNYFDNYYIIFLYLLLLKQQHISGL